MTDRSDADKAQGQEEGARWRRPVPLIGDDTSAADRAADPAGWAVAPEAAAALYDVIGRRRDVRRFRPEPVPGAVLDRILSAAHAAPSVGQSQPWRFVVLSDPSTRDRAASMADRARLAQADQMEPEAARHLLDLELEGIRQAPLGIVVCCDRRVPASGVLGRATFADADLWSCACAIENLWLSARAEGLGVGWVTLFEPDELASLIGLPDGVVTLGWLCVGWPDERPPDPGLERAGWSTRLPLDHVVLHGGWPADDQGPAPEPPRSRAKSPGPDAVVAARDDADELLTPPGSLGVLDRAVDRIVALGHGDLDGGTLVLVGGRHPVTELGISAFAPTVTDDVLAAAQVGQAVGAVAAAAAGLALAVIDAGTSSGNLRDADPLEVEAVADLVRQGQLLGRNAGLDGLVALGEVGIGNTTVAAALAAHLLGLDPDVVVGRGAGADSAMVDRKRAVVRAAVERVDRTPSPTTGGPGDALAVLGRLGGPEVAVLTGVVLGAAAVGAPVVLDGLLTSLAALIAGRADPGVAAHLIAGQRSREPAHQAVLVALGLEPLLDLRIRAGEGTGAALACGLLIDGLEVRRATGRTQRAATVRR